MATGAADMEPEPAASSVPTAGEVLYRVIRGAAALPDVRREVLRNHDDNRWWPLSVTDWRLRLVLAGWSTRVSYNMISTYQMVVARANALRYEQLSELSDEDAFRLVAPIGLASARIAYLRSVSHFLE